MHPPRLRTLAALAASAPIVCGANAASARAPIVSGSIADLARGEGPVAIFREDGFPAHGAASSPDALARIFRDAGIDVRFLDARELSDPEALRPERVRLLVLPYGRSFPASAREPFRAYLRAGGRFISLGGYAFLEPQVLEGARWIPEGAHLAARLEEAVRPERSLTSDPGFEREETASAPVGAAEPDGRWRRTSAEACRPSAAEPRSGERCAEVSLASPASAEWSAAIRPEPGRSYRASAWVKTQDVRGRGYAYAAVYQFAADGRLVAFSDFAQVRGTSPWTRYDLDVAPAPGVERLAFKSGIYDAAGTARFDDCVLADVTGLRPVPMTTATGTPADGLEVRPEEIGLFDADYPLRRVARLAAAPGQGIFPELSIEGAFGGWSATCVRGYDATRWISLLDALDRWGRLRGSAGSLVLHYGGPWAGSAWAAFGIETADIFDGASPEVARGLARLARFLLRGLWLAKLEPALAAYEPGGEATVAALVENRGREPVRAELEIRLASTVGAHKRRFILHGLLHEARRVSC
ncbi:MAG: hypothetical protein ACUVYA_17875 [Planctomycetota bacterium]